MPLRENSTAGPSQSVFDDLCSHRDGPWSGTENRTTATFSSFRGNDGLPHTPQPCSRRIGLFACLKQNVKVHSVHLLPPWGDLYHGFSLTPRLAWTLPDKDTSHTSLRVQLERETGGWDRSPWTSPASACAHVHLCLAFPTLGPFL